MEITASWVVSQHRKLVVLLAALIILTPLIGAPDTTEAQRPARPERPGAEETISPMATLVGPTATPMSPPPTDVLRPTELPPTEAPPPPTAAPPDTARAFTPTADAYVTTASPDANEGLATLLWVDGGTNLALETYLRFEVAEVTGRVTEAHLRLYAVTGTSDGPAIRSAANEWAETVITWNTRPAATSAVLDDHGPIGANTWVEYDVAGVVTANGVYTFVLSTTATGEIAFAAREHPSHGPQLVLEFDPNGPPAPSPAPLPPIAPTATEAILQEDVEPTGETGEAPPTAAASVIAAQTASEQSDAPAEAAPSAEADQDSVVADMPEMVAAATPEGAPLTIVRSGRSPRSTNANLTYDGDLGTSWYTTSRTTPDAGSFFVDLGSEQPIGAVRWVFQVSGAADVLRIQTSSDRRTWTTHKTVSNAPANEWQQMPLDVSARYVQFYFTNPNNIPVLGYIAEVEVWSATSTAIDSTATNTPTATETNTPTTMPTATNTSTPTNTPVAASTSTNTPSPTNTPTNTPIPSDSLTPTATSTPGNTPPSAAPFQEQGGQVVVEAEHAHETISRNGKSWVLRTERAGYAGSGYLAAEPATGSLINTNYVTTSPELRFQIEFSTPGTYYVWARALTDNDDDNSLHVGLNGQAVASADRMSTTNYGSWVWFQSTMDGPVATLSVPSVGAHTVNVWMREDGFRLDRLLLTTSTTAPSGIGPAERPRVGESTPTPTATATTPAMPTPTQCTTTIQALVDAAPAGSVVKVPPCIYRETVTITKPLTLDGQGSAEIRGSEVWTDWTESGGYWVHGTVPSFSSSGFCESGTSRCLWPEQVFFDGRPLLQVASNPVSGQFAVDGTRRIVLADDPTDHLVEVTTRRYWMVGKASGVTIQGFTMKHAATPAQQGALNNGGYDNWTIQNNVLSDAHGAPISLDYGSNLKLLNNNISRGGMVSVHGHHANGVLVQGNLIHAGNTEQFLRGWGGGGLKMAVMTNLTLDGNEVYDNYGPGLWCDINCYNSTISNNRVHHNTSYGISYEISHYATISGNIVWENGWRSSAWGFGAGILVQNSSYVEVFDNVVAWNADGITVIAQDRGNTSWNNVVENHVHDNVIIQAQSNVFALGWLQHQVVSLSDPASNNRGTSNRYWFPTPEGDGHRFEWPGKVLSRLADFNATPGEENGRYLSTAEKDQTLASANVPLTPDTR